DMDGVVVDNHFYHFKAWMVFAQKYQFELNEVIYRDKFNGKTNKDLFRMIFGDISSEDIERYSNEKEDLYQELYSLHVQELPGLTEFPEHLKDRTANIALGTSAPTRNVDFTLDTLSLRKYFEVIVDGTQVKVGKPDPQVYLLCAEKLGLPPQ